MGTKANPSKYDCYAKAADDEPLFTLRANDPYAPGIIQAWVVLAIRDEVEPEKIAEARACIEEMREWYGLNVPIE